MYIFLERSGFNISFFFKIVHLKKNSKFLSLDPKILVFSSPFIISDFPVFILDVRSFKNIRSILKKTLKII